MAKPAYVSIEYKRDDGIDTVTIEGWLTVPDGKVEHYFITPSLDFDQEVIKIGIAVKSIVAITPTASVREYNRGDDAVKYTDFLFEDGDRKGKGKRPLFEMFDRVVEDGG